MKRKKKKGIKTPKRNSPGPSRRRINKIAHKYSKENGAKITKYSIHIPGRKDLPLIIMLHGFKWGSKESMISAMYKIHDLGFEIYAYDAFGHHGRKGILTNWNMQLSDDLKKINTKAAKRRKVILIGQSMGATKALTLTARNPKKIDMCFSIGAVNGGAYPGKGDVGARILDFLFFPGDDLMTSRVQNIAPYKNANTALGKDKIYLIHARYDFVTEYKEFLLNQKDFGVPANQTLIIKECSHCGILWDARVLRFIKRKLKEKYKL